MDDHCRCVRTVLGKCTLTTPATSYLNTTQQISILLPVEEVFAQRRGCGESGDLFVSQGSQRLLCLPVPKRRHCSIIGTIVDFLRLGYYITATSESARSLAQCGASFARTLPDVLRGIDSLERLALRSRMAIDCGRMASPNCIPFRTAPRVLGGSETQHTTLKDRMRTSCQLRRTCWNWVRSAFIS